MKRIVSALVSILLLLSLVSCTEPSNSPHTDSNLSELISSDGLSSQATSSEIDERYEGMIPRTDVSLNKMTIENVFYSTAEVTDICLIDVSELDADTVETLRSLQGLVARNLGGAIYLHSGSAADGFWLEYCSTEYGFYFKRTTPADAIKRFSKYIKGAIIYSDDTPYEYTVANNVAIQSEYLVVTENSVSLVNSVLSNKPLIDIRKQFENKREAYDYIIENCLPSSSIRFLGFAGKGTAFADYLYAIKALVLDFDFSEEWETEMLSHLVGRPDWYDVSYVFTDRNLSTALVNTFSASGFGIINAGNFTNTTLLASASIEYSSNNTKYENKKLDKNMIYASIHYNVDSLSDVQRTAYTVWSHKSTNSAISVEFYPVLYEIAPPIAKWFRQNRTTNDMLVSGDLGCGLANLSVMDPTTAIKFRKINEYFLKMCGIDVVSDGQKVYTLSSFNDMLDGLVTPETESNITASMSFVDVEGFENWISNAEPISNAPMYFLIDLSATNFTGYEFVQVDKIVTRILKNKKDVIKFVHVKNILQYM